MTIPGVVARQAELSEQIRKEAYEKKPTEEKVETDLLETPPIEEPEKKPPVEEPPKEDWKTIHDKLYGQYAEVIAINKGLAEETANLRSKISDLRAETNALKAKEPTQPEPDEQEFASLKEQFPEVSKMNEIQLKREISKRDKNISALEERLGKLEAGVTTVTRRVDRTEGQGFEQQMDTLTDKRGNWRQMNAPGSEFLKWCGTEMSHGHSRYDLMMSSFQRGDFRAVAGHFNDFVAMKNPPKKGKEEVIEEENVGLPRPGSHGKPPEDKNQIDDKKTITRSFVKNTLKDIALRKYKNNPKEEKRLKDLIDDKTGRGLIIDG